MRRSSRTPFWTPMRAAAGWIRPWPTPEPIPAVRARGDAALGTAFAEIRNFLHRPGIRPLHPAAEEVPMKLATLRDLYISGLKELYSAEKQIIKARPKMAKAASS